VLTTLTASVMILCVRTYRDDEVPDVSWTRGYLVTRASSPTHGEHVAMLVTIYLMYYILITTIMLIEFLKSLLDHKMEDKFI
jgi:hypothetical protein